MIKKVRRRTKYIALIIMILGIIFWGLGIIDFKEKDINYNIDINKTADYKVFLKENKFYENNILDSGQIYASKSIEKIAVCFKYDFLLNKENNINYNYDITAEIEGKVNSLDSIIWQRKYVLKDKVYQNKINKKEFKVEENIDLDYGFFDNLAFEYEREYEIKIDAVLKLRFNIYYNISSLKNNKNNYDYIELVIPLNNPETEVKENYEKDLKEEVLFEDSKSNTKGILYIFLSIFSYTAAIVLTYLNVKNNKKTEKEIYEKKLKRILKNYRGLIVTVKNKPNLDNLEIINLELFEDLIDLAEQNQKNIIFYEIKKSYESEFYVIINRYVYVYKLKQDSTI